MSDKPNLVPADVYKLPSFGFWLSSYSLSFECDECGKRLRLGDPYVRAMLNKNNPNTSRLFHASCYFNGGAERHHRNPGGSWYRHVPIERFWKPLVEFRETCLKEYGLSWWRRQVERGIRDYAPIGYAPDLLKMVKEVSPYVK